MSGYIAVVPYIFNKYQRGNNTKKRGEVRNQTAKSADRLYTPVDGTMKVWRRLWGINR